MKNVTAVVALHLVSVTAAANKPQALFCSLYKRKGAARPKRRQRLTPYLVHGRKVVHWGEAPEAGAPGGYPGRCWFESNRPSHFLF